MINCLYIKKLKNSVGPVDDYDLTTIEYYYLFTLSKRLFKRRMYFETILVESACYSNVFLKRAIFDVLKPRELLHGVFVVGYFTHNDIVFRYTDTVYEVEFSNTDVMST